MRKSIIIGLVAALLLTIFVTENADPVDINLFFGEVRGYLSLILLICIILGVLLGIVFSMPSISKQSRMIHQKNRQIDRMKKLLDQHHIEYTPENKEKEKSKERKKEEKE